MPEKLRKINSKASKYRNPLNKNVAPKARNSLKLKIFWLSFRDMCKYIFNYQGCNVKSKRDQYFSVRG